MRLLLPVSNPILLASWTVPEFVSHWHCVLLLYKVSLSKWLSFVFTQEQFGRSWSKIAQLIPSRTTMQVKNYAQQYMKNVVSIPHTLQFEKREHKSSH